jgi:hypothetical protein
LVDRQVWPEEIGCRRIPIGNLFATSRDSKNS